MGASALGQVTRTTCEGEIAKIVRAAKNARQDVLDVKPVAAHPLRCKAVFTPPARPPFDQRAP